MVDRYLFSTENIETWQWKWLGTLEVHEKDVFDSGLLPSSNRYLIATDHFWETSKSGNSKNYNGITNG